MTRIPETELTCLMGKTIVWHHWPHLTVRKLVPVIFRINFFYDGLNMVSLSSLNTITNIIPILIGIGDIIFSYTQRYVGKFCTIFVFKSTL